MTDLLRRSHAPLTDVAWQEIDELAARVLKLGLVAREVVDVNGPHGWDLAAVNLGRLDLADESGTGDVPWGVRRVLPLVEVRLPFVLNQMELDTISRGARDANLQPLEEAAVKASLFEEKALYQGLRSGHMEGILNRATRPALTLPREATKVPHAVAEGVQMLTLAGIPGPYFLLLGKEPFLSLTAHDASSYPPSRVIRELMGGEIRFSPALEGGLLLSAAGGYFELTIGQDWSIGYAMHDRDTVELYLTESFAFRVLEPAAAVELASQR